MVYGRLQQGDCYHYVPFGAPERILNTAVDGGVGSQVKDILALPNGFFIYETFYKICSFVR